MTKIQIFIARETPADWVSRKIMKVIGADYSHIGIIVGTTVFHMVGKGFCEMHLEDMQKGHKLWTIDVTLQMKDIHFILGYLEGRRGVSYSQSQYIGFLFPWLRFLVRNNRSKGVCSEEVARFLLLCGKPEDVKDHVGKLGHLDFVSPKDVWEALKAEK